MPLEVNILALVLFISAVLGDSCNYMIGHFFGRKLFNNPDSRIFRQSHLEKTHEFYKKYGGKTIIIARFVPIVRTFAPFVAGMGKMHYYYFMVYNLIGELCGSVFSVMPVIFRRSSICTEESEIADCGYYCRFYIACRHRSRQE